MSELSLQNIDMIIRDVNRQEITYSHLPDELVDHLCCDIENEMHKGLSFNEAYNKVKKNMGKRRLKEIQEETLFAVDTKYRKMKNAMKISGITGTVILGFATIFKIMHWPGAGSMLMLGALILAFVFMPSALGVLWKETRSRKRIFIFVSAFLVAMFYITGSLFKIMHWPGAGIMLILAVLFSIIFFIPALLINRLRNSEKRSKKLIYILGAAGLVCYILGMLFRIMHWPGAGVLSMGGMIIIFFIVFPWYTWFKWKDENFVSARFIFMTIGSLAYIVPSALISLNLQRSYDDGFYIHQQQEQALYRCKYMENRSFLKNNTDTSATPVLDRIYSQTNDLLQVINGIEAEIIAESEAEPGKPVEITRQIIQTECGPEIQFNRLLMPFFTGSIQDFLLPERSSRIKLDQACKEYVNFLSALTPGDEPGKFKKLIDPSLYIQVPDKTGRTVSMMSVLHSLRLLKISILTVESYAFRAVIKRQQLNK